MNANEFIISAEASKSIELLKRKKRNIFVFVEGKMRLDSKDSIERQHKLCRKRKRFFFFFVMK